MYTMKKPTLTVFFTWVVLNIIVDTLMELALFSQLTPANKDKTELVKVIESQGWATLEWIFLIPANRLASTFLSVPQISLSSFVFDFATQLAADRFWLGVPTTLDDYIGVVLAGLGIAISTLRLAG